MFHARVGPFRSIPYIATASRYQNTNNDASQSSAGLLMTTSISRWWRQWKIRCYLYIQLFPWMNVWMDPANGANCC